MSNTNYWDDPNETKPDKKKMTGKEALEFAAVIWLIIIVILLFWGFIAWLGAKIFFIVVGVIAFIVITGAAFSILSDD